MAYGYTQLYHLAIRAGATPTQATNLAAIAMAESSGDPTALNSDNRDGSRDHGLWQINDKAWAGTFDFSKMNDPLYNAQAAIHVMRTQGLTAWSTYNDQQYQSYLPGGPDPTAQAPTNALAQQVIDYGMQYLGTPYQWGGSAPGGFDCSGLVQYVYKKFGVDLPRVADQQQKVGTPVGEGQARPGDLVWFDENSQDANGPGADHIGIYLGNGEMLAAPHTGAQVSVESINNVGITTGFTRVLPDHAWDGMPSNGGQYVYNPVGGNVPALNPSANAQLTQQDFTQGLDAAGFPKALIESIPELKKIFDTAIQKKEWLTPAGQTRFLTAIKSTHWYQTTATSLQHYEALKVTQPGEYQTELTQKLADTKAMSQALGLNLRPTEINSIAERAMTMGLDNAQMRSLMAAHLQYKSQQAYTGQVGIDVNAVKAMASNYGVSVTDGTIQNLIKGLITGGTSDSTTGLDASGLTDYFKQLAISKFPHLQKQFEQGLTLTDIADPYKQEMGKILEVNPNQVTNDDPTLMKALQQPDQQGGFQLMPIYQWQQQLRQDPRWLATNNARDSMMDMGTGLLKQMGLTV